LKSQSQNQIKLGKLKSSSDDSVISEGEEDSENIIEDICDENLETLNKIHAILLNCSNLSKKQKLEFCESERYFMKQYLLKVKNKNDPDG
jgi:hypothetical protein